MGSRLSIVLLFAVIAISVGLVSAGSSSITLSKNVVNFTHGGIATIDYTVSLASGDASNTTLSVLNQSQLRSDGVSITLTKPAGSPPFSGVMTLKVFSASNPASYRIALRAAGGDPSADDAIVTLNILDGAVNTTTTTVQQTSSTVTTTVLQSQSNSQSSGLGTAVSAFIIIVVLAAAYLMFKWKSGRIRFVLLVSVLVLIGIVAWLYGYI